MLSSLKTRLRRLIRGYQRSAQYPVLLPHHALTDDGVTPLRQAERMLPEPVRRALPFCDGLHTVNEVAERAAASRSQIIAAQEHELIVLWERAVPATAPVVADPARVTRVILSPHPDDAALSLGGAMLTWAAAVDQEAVEKTAAETSESDQTAAADTDSPPAESPAAPTPTPAESDSQRSGEPSGPETDVRQLTDQTLVVNVFTRSAWWRFPPAEGAADLSAETPAIQAIRAEEDDLVSRLAHTPMRALDLDEALLRGHAIADIFTAPLGERDAAASDAVRSAVIGLAAEFPNTEFYLPLAIGRHVDHRLVRDAALTGLREAGVPLARVRLFEDLPYAARGETSDLAEAHPALKLTPSPVDVSVQVDAKLEMLRVYWSQFSWSQLPELKAHAKDAETGAYVERVHAVGE